MPISIFFTGLAGGYGVYCISEEEASIPLVYATGRGAGDDVRCIAEGDISNIAIYGVGEGDGFGVDCAIESDNPLLAIYGVGEGDGFGVDCAVESDNPLLGIYGVGEGDGFGVDCAVESDNPLLAIYGVGEGDGFGVDCAVELDNPLLAIYGVGEGDGFGAECAVELDNPLLAIYGVGEGDGFGAECAVELDNPLLAIYGVGEGDGYGVDCAVESDNPLLAIYGVGEGDGFGVDCAVELDNPLLAIYGVGEGDGCGVDCAVELDNPLLAIYGVGEGDGYGVDCFMEDCPLITGVTIDTMDCDSVCLDLNRGGIRQKFYFYADSLVYDTLVAVSGCDSLQPYHVIILRPGVASAIDTVACDSVALFGDYYFQDTVIFDTLAIMASNGCDSIQPYNVVVLDCGIDLIDPCGCADPLNYGLGTEYYFREFVTVTSVPGLETWIDVSASTGDYDDMGAPLSMGDVTLTEVSSGIYEGGLWVRRGEDYNIIVSNERDWMAMISGLCDEVCEVPFLNCIANLNVGCGDSIMLSDLVTLDLPNLEDILTLRIEDEFGTPVGPKLPSDFTGKLWAHVTDSRMGTTCETEIEVSDKEVCTLRNTLDTTLWCVDDFLDVDVLSDYYKDTLGLRPLAYDGCSGEFLGYAQYDGEWVTTFECGPSTGSGQGDTLKQVLRRWYWENKDGSECSAFDTLTLIRLPNIADYVYAPQKDTVSCVYDTILDSTEVYREVCWKQLVGLHNDGTMIYYPVAEMMDAADSEILIIRKNGFIERVDSIRNNYPQVLYRGKQSYEVEVFKGDKVRSNDGRFEYVDEDWFYEGDGSQHVTWIDICVPTITYDVDTTVCDKWAEEVCKGIELILPDHPYEPESCKIFCLSELTGDDKCVEVIHVDIKEVAGSCPRVEKRNTLVKQTCFAEGVATLEDLRLECALDTNTSGITREETMNGSLFMEVEQWIIYEDTLPPLSIEEGRVIRYNTDAHSCEGDIEIPRIPAKDVCSGVKNVKATLVWNGHEMGLGWVELSDDDGDGYWTQEEGDRRLRIACGGPYQVKYEVQDSCHNTLEVFRHEVYMEDRTAPTVITDDTLSLSLGGKEVWLPASTFDEGSSDNCDIVRRLVRRADWLETCGVDVCVDGLSEITSEAELERYIAANGITVGLGDSDIERTYAEQYEWLVEDGQWCEDDYLREQLILGWEEDIKNAWIEEGCLGEDEHGDRLVSEGVDVWGTSKGVNREAGGLGLLSTTNSSILGGGWSEEVAFCCEDACSDVVVEVLMIDKGCNFTRGWVVIRVEDKSTVEKAMDFDELTIGCSSYDERYGSLVEAAAEGNEAALDQLDELLGGLKRGWRSDDNRLGDYDGNEINKEFTYMTSKCSTQTIERKVLDTAHDGEVKWETIEEEVNVLYEEEEEAEVGGVFVKCGSRVERDVWIELKDCGQGKVTRRWLVYGGCADRSLSGGEGSGAEGSDHGSERPLIFEQVIYVVSDCPLNKASLNVPNDTMICSDLMYDMSGNLDLDVEELSYGLGDLSCRELGIGYEDEILRIVGDADKRKVHRTWTVNDWCSGEVIECVQKIVVDMSCAIESAVEGEGVEASRADNDARGSFQLYQNRPNPFVDQSVIRFRLPEATKTKLTLFDASGRTLQVIEKTYAAGVHEEVIDARELGSRVGGVIYYQLDTETHTATKQMVRLK